MREFASLSAPVRSAEGPINGAVHLPMAIVLNAAGAGLVLVWIFEACLYLDWLELTSTIG